MNSRRRGKSIRQLRSEWKNIFEEWGVTDEDLLDIVRADMKFVDSCEGDESIYPTIVTHCLDGNGGTTQRIHVCDTDFNTPDEKSEIMTKIAQLHFKEKHRVVVVSLISEAWCSTVAPEDIEKFTRPSLDPQRREIALVAAASIDNRAFQNFREITRTADNRIRFDKPWPDMSTFENVTSPILEQFLRTYTRLVATSAIARNN